MFAVDEERLLPPVLVARAAEPVVGDAPWRGSRSKESAKCRCGGLRVDRMPLAGEGEAFRAREGGGFGVCGCVEG